MIRLNASFGQTVIMKTDEEIWVKAKNAILEYLKSERDSTRTNIEESRIYKDLKEKQNYGTIEVMRGLMLIKEDIRKGDKSVEMTKQGGYTYYRYAG